MSDVRSQIADRRSHMGFTLVELMVVIAIILIILILGLPAIGTLFSSGRLTNAERSVSSTVAAARAYATRPVFVEGGPYQGAAALFLTDNTVRIVQHTTNFGTKNDIPEFTDVQDPLYLPGQIKVVAISRGGTGSGNLYLVRPPFAIRFDRNGMMIVRRYTTSNQPSCVHHREINDDDSDLVANLYKNNGDGVASVLGLIVFDTDDAAEDLNDADMDALTDLLDPTKSITEISSGNAYNWVLENGIPMLFNRYSGAVMKGEQR